MEVEFFKPTYACSLKIYFVMLIFIISGCQIDNNDDVSSENDIQNPVRKIVEISENWKFQIDIKDIGEKDHWYLKDHSNWSEVNVPQAWNFYENALWQYQGIGWYSTNIKTEDVNPNEKVTVEFGRVMYYSKVWLNGKFLGENIGGYLPFSFDISKYLRQGDNKLVLRVDNRANINWLPASEQIEWIQYGGIIEPVKIVSKSQIHISDIIVRTVLGENEANLNCITEIINETVDETEIDLTVRISLQTELLKKSLKVLCKPNEKYKVNLDFNIEQPELWSPETPVLYTVSADLHNYNDITDNYSDRFGIREITTEGTSILLNGKPVNIKGTHRYDYYGNYGPNPPEDFLRKELELMKSIGINTIRVHFPASPQVLDLYDEYGFLMFEEIPLNWWGKLWPPGITPIGGKAEQSIDILDQAKPFLSNMIKRDKNHPSIILWSMANESNTESEIGIAVMRELLRLSKSLDPTRLVSFVSGNDPTKHLGFDEADIVCFNQYVACNYIDQIDSVAYYPIVEYLNKYRMFFPDKPIVMTEFGRQGIKGITGDVFFSEDFQAAYIKSIWKALSENPTISGGILWTWADYYHELHFTLESGYSFYGISTASYGPYGVITFDGEYKKSLNALAEMYGGFVPKKFIK